MNENSIITAIKILKEIIAKEVLYPKSERNAGILKPISHLESSNFNIDDGELLQLLFGLEKKGFLEILDDTPTFNWKRTIANDKDGIPADEVFVEKENKKHFNYEAKDIDGIKRFIRELEDEINGNKSSMNPIIYIDDKKGIYRTIDDTDTRYPHVNSKSKIFMTISYLMVNKSATLRELSKHNGQLEKTLKRDISSFNKTARSRLKLSVNPIVGEGVYSLNRNFINFK